MPIPKFDQLFNPLLRALQQLGGSASNAELVDEVGKILGLSDEELEEQTSRGQPRFAYRLAWARSYLKIFGLINNSERGVWSLTAQGKATEAVDPVEVKRFVRQRRHESASGQGDEDAEDAGEAVADDRAWKERLLKLLHALEPAQFERLCQRILRESGFVQVEVTGRSGDGGIDGVGVVELGGLLTFPVLFQCKRYRDSVGPNVVRDFRGAMVGRSDRGLILTTGLFTREAQREARRDGAPPVDLIDRERLLDKLKELGLGVKTELVEAVVVEEDSFQTL